MNDDETYFPNKPSARGLERGAKRVYMPHVQAKFGHERRVLVIDNYDSFTFNLVQFLLEIGAKVSVVRNDEVSVADTLGSGATHLLLSPGPGRPAESGVCFDLVERLVGSPTIPALGVCLGHQILCQHLGATVAGADSILHGKRSGVRHTGSRLYNGVPNPFVVGRYHSLSVDAQTLPASLTATAFADDGALMSVEHDNGRLFGVQYHPESILSEHGHRLLRNFLLVL